MATKIDMMNSTVSSWGSWGKGTGGFNTSKNDMMAATGDSWMSAGSWTRLPVQFGIQLKEVVFAKSSPFELVVTDRMLLDCFRQLDVRGDGVIPMKQLYKAFHRCGFRVSKKAMQAVIRDMGVDPAEGIDAQDFVTFFRRSEQLTLDTETNKPRLHCGSRCCFCLIFSSLVVTCTFLVLLMFEEGESDKKDVFKLGLATGGGIMAFLIVTVLLLPALGHEMMKIGRVICECCSWLSSQSAARREARKTERSEPRADPKIARAAVVKHPLPPAVRFEKQTVVAASYRAGEQPNYVMQPAATTCQAATRSKRGAPSQISMSSLESAATAGDGHSNTSHNNGSHSNGSPGKRQHQVPKALRPYDPGAYQEAASLARAHVPTNANGALNLGPQKNVQLLANLPARPGAATKTEDTKKERARIFHEAVRAGWS